jgi:superfamily II DNA or RNA helicase
MNKDKRNIYFVAGETDTTDRESIRKIVEKEDNAIIVASLGTFSTGINIRNLHNILFCSPWKSIIKVLQSIGRVLRLSDSGQGARLIDFVDDLRKGKYVNYSLQHGSERIKIYKGEEFEFKTHVVKIPEG